jgi:hypothetical protein
VILSVQAIEHSAPYPFLTFDEIFFQWNSIKFGGFSFHLFLLFHFDLYFPRDCSLRSTNFKTFTRKNFFSNMNQTSDDLHGYSEKN